MSERYYDENDNLAILICDEYRKGCWADDNYIEFSTDRRLVELVLTKGAENTVEEAYDICRDIIKEKYGKNYQYLSTIRMNSWKYVRIVWIPSGELFRIRKDEYFGGDLVEIFDESRWLES